MKYAPPAGVDDDRSCDEGNLSAHADGCRRIIAAMRPTLASTRRSEEISFVMNPKSARVAVPELGPDADAFEAAHDAIACADFAQFPAHRAARHQHDDRHPCADARPRARHHRPGRRCAGWSWSRSRPARSRPSPSRARWHPARRPHGSRMAGAPRGDPPAREHSAPPPSA